MSALEDDANTLIATAGELAWAGNARSKKEACEMALAMLLHATAALAKGAGLTEEQFGEDMVAAWESTEVDVSEVN